MSARQDRLRRQAAAASMRGGAASDAAPEADYYDRVYAAPGRKGASLAVDRAVVATLRGMSADRVVDLGCGTGSIVELLPAGVDYVGVDFSEVALRIARGRATAANVAFTRMDLRHTGAWSPFAATRVVVCAETLEHLDDDLGLLGALPSGCRCVLTVPRRNDPAYVRFFPDLAGAVARYHEIVRVDVAETVQERWHVLRGVRL